MTKRFAGLTKNGLVSRRVSQPLGTSELRCAWERPLRRRSPKPYNYRRNALFDIDRKFFQSDATFGTPFALLFSRTCDFFGLHSRTFS